MASAVSVDQRCIGVERAQVRAGGEDLVVGRRQDDAPHGVIVAGVAKRVQQPLEQRRRERVARLRVVEGDGRDAAFDFVEDKLLGHGRPR